jgi:hypothetical protein
MTLHSDDEWRLIEQLRGEASEVKHCFTTYSLSALALSGAALGAVLGTLKAAPTVRYAPLALIPLLMIVSRLGIYKFATANRNNGYELHLARCRHEGREKSPAELPTLGGVPYLIPWEEALRAWRIVQATLFRVAYNTPERDPIARRLNGMHMGFLNRFLPHIYRHSDDTKRVIERYQGSVRHGTYNSVLGDQYPWFMPALLVKTLAAGDRPAVYHGGTFIREMLGVLLWAQLFLLIPLGLSVDWTRPLTLHRQLDFAVLVATLALVVLRYLRVRRRREILEEEMLCIHSCAITWEAVVLAHLLAVTKVQRPLWHYTEALAAVAHEMAKSTFDIFGWIEWAKGELHAPRVLAPAGVRLPDHAWTPFSEADLKPPARVT